MRVDTLRQPQRLTRRRPPVHAGLPTCAEGVLTGS